MVSNFMLAGSNAGNSRYALKYSSKSKMSKAAIAVSYAKKLPVLAGMGHCISGNRMISWSAFIMPNNCWRPTALKGDEKLRARGFVLTGTYFRLG